MRVTASCPVSAQGAASGTAPTQFSGVSFAGTATGWAAGVLCASPEDAHCGGVIEGTANGGNTWGLQYRVPNPVTRVQAIDATHAVALTSAGKGCPAGEGTSCTSVVLAASVPSKAATGSIGGGWAAKAAIHADVDDISFSTPSAGWAAVRGCGLIETTAPCPGQVLGTTDGGSHWGAELNTPGPIIALASLGSEVWAVEAVPGQTPVKQPSGYIPAGPPAQVYFSSDGGEHWGPIATIAVPDDYEASGLQARLSFTLNGPAGPVGMLSLFNGQSCAMHGCGVADLFRSADGGAKWEPVSPKLDTTYDAGCGPDAPPLFATDANGGWLTTASVSLAACSPPATTLYSSANGGASFTILHTWTGLGLAAMAFPGANQGWAVSAFSGVIIHTTDGGATWTQQLPATSPITAIDFTSAATGWGVGTAADEGAVLRSDDGAGSWSVVASLPGVVEGLSALSATHAYVVDESSPSADWSIMATTDGGTTWSTLYTLAHRPGQASDAVAAFQMIDATQGVMVTTPPPGPVGLVTGLPPATLLSTSNGGRTWGHPHPLPVGNNDQLATPDGVSFSSPSTGWAVIGDELLGTADGGGHWSEVGTVQDYSNDLGVDRVSAKVGFVTVPGGETSGGQSAPSSVLATTDGGATWRRYELPLVVRPGVSVQTGWLQVSMLGASRGWLLANGTVLRLAL
ncbi:MAG: WD40/YVTN/BNR-like repeat-containing protein [Acidimicrobiales bacterium]